MYKLNDLYSVVNEIAPIEYSKIMIANGDYDNSGIIINHHETVEKVLFSLDLSVEAVKKAKRLKCDTIITHHPAIYRPVSQLNVDDVSTKSVLLSASYGINVISMHLNLDVATGGIDDSLKDGLGGEKYKILDYVVEGVGYGREFPVNKKLSVIKADIKKVFRTDKIIVYGNKNTVINKIASFCGGGSSHALSAVKGGLTDADLIITSDMPHHVIKELIEEGKNIIILPHYVSEEYGFNKFYSKVENKLKNKINTYYFDDKRFR